MSSGKLFFWALLALLISTGQPARAQEPDERARAQLKAMRNGVLLVRLPTRDLAQQALAERNRTEELAKLRQKLYEENKETLLAFRHAFDFCPVYFFYSSHSDSIRQGKLEGVVFNSELEYVEASTFEGKPIFTGEFSQTPKLDIEAFVIMDQDMFPLEKPFPFYQRKFILFSLIELSRARMAEKLNKKLHSYYRSWIK